DRAGDPAQPQGEAAQQERGGGQGAQAERGPEPAETQAEESQYVYTFNTATGQLLKVEEMDPASGTRKEVPMTDYDPYSMGYAQAGYDPYSMGYAQTGYDPYSIA